MKHNILQTRSLSRKQFWTTTVIRGSKRVCFTFDSMKSKVDLKLSLLPCSKLRTDHKVKTNNDNNIMNRIYFKILLSPVCKIRSYISKSRIIFDRMQSPALWLQIFSILHTTISILLLINYIYIYEIIYFCLRNKTILGIIFLLYFFIFYVNVNVFILYLKQK